MFRKYWRTQIQEIAGDRALLIYGAALCLLHVYTFIYWDGSLPWSSGNEPSFCWPFATGCESWRVLPPAMAEWLARLYAGLAIVCGGLFLCKQVTPAFWLLFGLTVFKYAAVLSNMQLMGNYHYMGFIITFAWLFLPDKLRTPQIFLLLFYFTAGTLKLNPEWLTGASLGKFPFWLAPDGIWLLMAAGVVLELIVVFGLALRSPLYRWGALASFALFHLISFYWVGWYYPVNMWTLLVIFPLSWHKGIFLEDTAYLRQWRTVPRALAAAIALYVLAQTVPYWSARDPALDGLTRIPALNMYDARTSCYASLMLKYDSHSVEYDTLTIQRRPIRIHCDPLFFIAEARNLCREQSTDPAFRDADLGLLAKRSTDLAYKPLMAVRDICKNDRERGLFHWYGGGVPQ